MDLANIDLEQFNVRPFNRPSNYKHFFFFWERKKKLQTFKKGNKKWLEIAHGSSLYSTSVMALSNELPSCLFQSRKLQSLLKQLLFFFLFLLLLPLAMSISFNFTSFNKENITVKRDASIKPDGTIQLAEPSYFSAGRAYYNKPVHLWDNSAGRLTVTDFTTHFSFII